MTGEFGTIAHGIADAGSGAVLARTVEPAAGETGGHTNEAACLNCGTPLVGPHCHACGQRGHVHRTLGAFFHDLLHGVLHFEGKIWRTVPLLAWKPGKLTREYIDGRRASYVSPIALFLFVVFLSFALFNALGSGASGIPTAQVAGAMDADFAENTRELERLKVERTTAQGEERAEIDRKVADLEAEQRALSALKNGQGGEFTRQFVEGFSDSPEPNNAKLSQMIQHVRENPQLAIYKAQTSAYKYSWMLIPLSVPFVWLLFPLSRRFGGYDHTVFVTYSITFMIALAAVVSLLFYVNAGGVGGLLLLYAPFHMYRQLRGTYGLSRLGAVWRMLALSLFAWIAIGLFAAAIFWMAGA
ncbi:DUF3667 domain-containing protein [Altererythrobacter aerius]|uniref:DUF3667 domain-containing protein n=1 Tax=Tsuneonella aeria TaxID=1837929 RepID=A0A6I4TCP3_9SPHN|nr:DUF3667 domain-containing protein [Tsuneonella aeria]MXO75101.1 DUF3667 domain-containing protein [Tsuneonella aeria]